MNKSTGIFVLALSALVAFGIESTLDAQPVHSAGGNSLLDAESFELENGFRIIVQPDRRAPIIVSQVWYRVGSAHEHDGITGISHMLEHMMFKGTKNLKSGEFSKIVSQEGGVENAFTSNDYTAYYQKWASKNLEVSIKLEAERMRRLVLKDEEFQKERAVVLEERALRVSDNPLGDMRERFRATAFMSSPYRQPIIGWQKDIENYKLEDLKVWYDKYYHPSNATLVVVGDVSPDNVFKLAKKYFGGFPPVQLQQKINRLEEPQKGTKRLNIISEKAKIRTLMMAYKVPSLPALKMLTDSSEDEVYALEVLANVLGGYDGARLDRKIVRELKLANSISISYSPTSLLPDLLTIVAFPTNGTSLEDLEDAIKKELAEISLKPPEENELKKVVAQAISSSVYERDSISYQAILIGSLDAVGLDWRIKDSYADKIKGISSAQIMQAAQKYLKSNLLTVATMVPGEKDED